MRRVKISIVMPVYNVEKYLVEALDSIRKQTFKCFEVILVDDGSNDKSAEICDKYCILDERFQVIHQVNSGAALARNVGAKKASGKYIIFLDADDVFKLNFFKKMYIAAEENSADVCICGFEEIDINGRVLNSNLPNVSRNREAEDYLVTQFLAPWVKLCRRSFLKKKSIEFQNLSSCNDVYYSVCTLLEADRISYVQEELVKYRVRTTKFQISANWGRACDLLLDRYLRNDSLKKRIQIIVMCLKGMVHECKSCADEEKNKELYDFIKNGLINRKECQYIKDKSTENAIYMIMKNEYSKEVINELFSFDKQLMLNGKQILEKLNPYKSIVVWGIGERGKAFLRFCAKNNIMITAVTDKRYCYSKEKNELEYPIVNAAQALHMADLIIAGNDVVYDAIKHNTDITILNLQQFI